MNNFNKEYIKECDCKEIQGLRKRLVMGDYYMDTSSIQPKEINLSRDVELDNRSPYSWLPTGDQLDEEIVKICKKKFYEYEFFMQWDNCKISYFVCVKEDGNLQQNSRNDNPLIAKILLLKELLK